MSVCPRDRLRLTCGACRQAGEGAKVTLDLLSEAQWLDFWEHWKGLPGQKAGILKLRQDMLAAKPELLAANSGWIQQYRDNPSSPATAKGWLEPALEIIREFEGCHLTAYLCPAGVPTIGWGSTRISGRAVEIGDSISQSRADQLLVDDLQARYTRLVAMLPMARQWPGHRVAALISWAYNVGNGAVAGSTLRKRLLAGDNSVKAVSEELPRWNKANGKPLAGLTRRRAAEVALFAGSQPNP